jgi:hypothetical protein
MKQPDVKADETGKRHFKAALTFLIDLPKYKIGITTQL